MVKLGELATLIRSKNAGPFHLTIDIMFDNDHQYRQVKEAGILRAETFAALYNVPVDDVKFFEHDRALAFKATMPRPIPQGGLGESDMYAGQQFDPVSQIEVPA